MIPLAYLITFSTYHKKKLFKEVALYELFLDSLDCAKERYQFKIAAYVMMPNHVHLLLQVTDRHPLASILRAIKQPFSHRALKYLAEHYPGTYAALRVEHAGKVSYRFWQAGGGSKQPIRSGKSLTAARDYIHMNPVRSGFVLLAHEWPWSSAGKMRRC